MDALQEVFSDKQPAPLFYPNELEAIPYSEDGMRVTETEYWENYYEHDYFSYEWNNGYLEERPVSGQDGYLMHKWILILLEHYLSENPIGVTMGLEFGFRLKLPHKTAIRKPDLALVLNDNPIALHLHDPCYAGIFDLCIEVVSYSSKKNIERDTVVKMGEYALGGVREYYILDSRGIETAFYRLNRRGTYEAIHPKKGGIIESQVLPGFKFRKSDLYRQPSLKEIANDDLYKHFVLSFYQAEKQKVKLAEEQMRQTEEQMRQTEEHLCQERAHTARLAAKLKELGISVE